MNLQIAVLRTRVPLLHGAAVFMRAVATTTPHCSRRGAHSILYAHTLSVKPACDCALKRRGDHTPAIADDGKLHVHAGGQAHYSIFLRHQVRTAVGPCRISAVPFCSVRLRCSTGSSRQPRTFIRIIQRYELRSLYNSLHRCQRMVYHHPSYRRCLMANAICS